MAQQQLQSPGFRVSKQDELGWRQVRSGGCRLGLVVNDVEHLLPSARMTALSRATVSSTDQGLTLVITSSGFGMTEFCIEGATAITRQ